MSQVLLDFFGFAFLCFFSHLFFNQSDSKLIGHCDLFGWFNDTWEKSSWSLAIPSSHKFKQSAYQCKREYHQVFQEFHLGMLSKPLVVSHFLVRYLFPCWSDWHTNCLEACGSQSIWNHKSNEFDIFSGQHYLRKAHGKWSSSLWDYSLKKKNHSQISLLMLTMRKDLHHNVQRASQSTKPGSNLTLCSLTSVCKISIPFDARNP